MLRRRRQEAGAAAADSPAGAVGAQRMGTRYRMTQRMASIGDDFGIQDDTGQRVFKVDGKAVRVRDTLVFRDMNHNEICKIQERMLRVRDTMNVEGPCGETLATVKSVR